MERNFGLPRGSSARVFDGRCKCAVLFSTYAPGGGLGAIGGEHSIPNMADALRPYFENVTSAVIAESGHFVPEEQPEALAKALRDFL